MEILRHGRRQEGDLCEAGVIQKSTKTCDKINCGSSVNTDDSNATTRPLVDAHDASQMIPKSRMNSDFCGIFGTDMEVMP